MNAVIVQKHFLPQLNCENMSEYIQEKPLYPAIFVAKVSKGIPIWVNTKEFMMPTGLLNLLRNCFAIAVKCLPPKENWTGILKKFMKECLKNAVSLLCVFFCEKFPKILRIPKNFSNFFWKYLIPYIAFRDRKPFQAWFIYTVIHNQKFHLEIQPF